MNKGRGLRSPFPLLPLVDGDGDGDACVCGCSYSIESASIYIGRIQLTAVFAAVFAAVAAAVQCPHVTAVMPKRYWYVYTFYVIIITQAAHKGRLQTSKR